MKKIIISIAALAFASLPVCLMAQDEKKEKEVTIEKKGNAEKKETEEIVIRNKGGKDMNLKVEINGEKVTVNGKPLAEFKDDQVIINKRKMFIRDGDGMMAFDFGPGSMEFSKDLMRQWKDSKEVIKPFLGVTTEKVTEGAKIVEIVKESAAWKAGLKKDDIITRVGDEIIKDGEHLSEAISSKKPKDVVNVTYIRNGKEGSVKAVLGERKIKSQIAHVYSFPRDNVRPFSNPRILGEPGGEMINEEDLRDFNTNPHFQEGTFFPRQKKIGLKIQDTEEGGNVKVIEVEEGSAAEKAGLKKDDIISEIGGVKIENTDDAREQLFPSESKSTYTIKAKRGAAEMSFEVRIPKKLKTANL